MLFLLLGNHDVSVWKTVQALTLLLPEFYGPNKHFQINFYITITDSCISKAADLKLSSVSQLNKRSQRVKLLFIFADAIKS